MATKNGFDDVLVMRVTPMGPAEPAAADPADAGADDDADGDVVVVDAPGVLQAAATTAKPAISTTPRNPMTRFLDWIMRGSSCGRNVDNVVCGL
jgi:hypothetical protein